MTDTFDTKGRAIFPGDLVRRVGDLRTGAGRPGEKVIRTSRDGRSVYVEACGDGVRVREWVSSRVVEKVDVQSWQWGR